MATGKLTAFSEEEREQIRKVLLRDEHLRSQERDRLRQIEMEIETERNKEKAALSDSRFNDRVCIRCYATLIWLFFPGERCDVCRFKVCRDCIEFVKELKKNMCTTCKKRREYSLKSCTYFNAVAFNVRRLVNQGVPAVLDPLRDSDAKRDVEKLMTDSRYYDANAAFYMQFSKAVQDLYDHVEPKLRELSPTMGALVRTSDLLLSDVVLQSHRLRMVVAAKRFTQNLTDIAGSLQHKETMSSLRLYSAIRRILLEEVFKLLGMSISNEVIANPPVSANRIDSDDDEMDEKPKIAYLEQIVIDCIIDKIVQSLAAARLNNLVNSSENGKDSNNLSVASLLRSGSLRSLAAKKKRRTRVSANERRRQVQSQAFENFSLASSTAASVSKRLPENGDSDSDDMVPQFVELPKSVYASENDRVQLSCKVHCAAETRVGWFRHDATGQLRELKGDMRFKPTIQTLDNTLSDGILLHCMLLISSVNASDNGTYIVIAQNQYGQSMNKIKLVIKGVVENHRHSLALGDFHGRHSARNANRNSLQLDGSPKLSPLHIVVVDRRVTTPTGQSLGSENDETAAPPSGLRPVPLLAQADKTEPVPRIAGLQSSPLAAQTLASSIDSSLPKTQQVRLRSGQVVTVTLPPTISRQTPPVESTLTSTTAISRAPEKDVTLPGDDEANEKKQSTSESADCTAEIPPLQQATPKESADSVKAIELPTEKPIETVKLASETTRVVRLVGKVNGQDGALQSTSSQKSLEKTTSDQSIKETSAKSGVEKAKEPTGGDADAEFSRVKLKKTGKIEQLIAEALEKDEITPAESVQSVSDESAPNSNVFHEFQKVRLRGGRMSQLLQDAVPLPEEQEAPEVDSKVKSDDGTSLPDAQLQVDTSAPLAEQEPDGNTASAGPKADGNDDLDDLLMANTNADSLDNCAGSKRVTRRRVSRLTKAD